MRALKIISALAFASAFGCSAPVITVGVTLVTAVCPGTSDSQRDPIDNVTTLNVTLSGDGLAAKTVQVPFSSGGASIPNVPVGTNRRLVVEAPDATTGLVRSRADSGPFDVSASGGDVKLTLFLRVIDAFVYTGAADNSTCTRLNIPRAGHQMTLLPDGLVLITGGYNIDGTGTLHYLTQAEIYDPHDGSFSLVAAQENIGRAGHAAFPVVVNNEPAIVLLDGESMDPNVHTLVPAGFAEFWQNEGFTEVSLPASLPARERTAVAIDQRKGYAVSAGGANGPSVPGGSVTVYDSIGYFNPQQATLKAVAEPLAQPLADMVAVGPKNQAPGGTAQGGIVLIGGVTQAGAASAQLSGLLFNDTNNDYFADTRFEAGNLSALPAPRVRHAAIVADDDTIFVMGGQTSANDTYGDTTNAITVVSPANVLVASNTQVLSQARADGCAASLANGNLMYLGGAYGDSGGTHSSSVVDVIAPNGPNSSVRALEGPTSGHDWSLQQSRYRAACVTLANGSVLVTGGLQAVVETGTVATLTSAEIYTPSGH